MGPYGGFWAGLRRATTFKGRRGTTSARLGEDPPHVRTLRAGRSRRARKEPRHPLRVAAVTLLLLAATVWAAQRVSIGIAMLVAAGVIALVVRGEVRDALRWRKRRFRGARRRGFDDPKAGPRR